MAKEDVKDLLQFFREAYANSLAKARDRSEIVKGHTFTKSISQRKRRPTKLLTIAFILLLSTTRLLSQSTDKIISYLADPQKEDIQFYWKDDSGRLFRNIQNLKTYLEHRHRRLLFAMNGGMFKVDYAPVGLFIQERQEVTPLDTSSGSGNFYLKPNGVFYITTTNKAGICQTTDFVNNAVFRFATQSGPMLLIDGQIHPAFKKGSSNLNIRNGVGLLPGNRLLFAISEVPVNFYDFADFFKSQGCKNALYLDGFVSKMYLSESKWEQTDGDLGVIIGASVAATDSVTLGNNTVARTFRFSKDSTGFYSKTFINKASGKNYVNPATEEFSIRINDSVVTGLNCRYVNHFLKDSGDTRTLTVTLQTPLAEVYIQLLYELYADIPLIRKQLRVINKSAADLVLTDLDVEKLRFQVVDKFLNEVYSNYGTNMTRIPYKGDYNDAAVMLYNLAAGQGAIFGNEAPGALKNTEIYTNIHGCIQVGMRHIDETYPFKTWVHSGEIFESPGTFIYVFNSFKWQDGFEGAYKDFVRKYLGVSKYTKTNSPLFLYDTWRPFEDTLDQKLIRDCADKLASTGADLFIIDAGWYKYSGDFIPDSSKFPDGIKAVCDYIRSKGMQVGIWFTLAGVNAKSKIAQQHPDWLIRDRQGNVANLHSMASNLDGTGWGAALKTMSLGSPYYDYIRNCISAYIRQLGVTYVKLDLSIVASAYVNQPELTGDYESNPSKLYRDHASSYWTIYERCLQLMDELHMAFPGIFIDCTFETWGRYNVADYALLEHADYDWLANLEFEPPLGPMTIRQMNYDRSRVIPASPLLIGNQNIDNSGYKYAYLSLASGSQVMVGDPRRLTPEQQAFYNKWSAYFKIMEAKYQYSSFYELYDIFDRPTNNNWDGCYRINTEKQGGLMFFYRNNSSDERRTFKIPCLHPTDRYKIYSFETGRTLGKFSGRTLMDKGITVTIPSTYTAQVLTIEKI